MSGSFASERHVPLAAQSPANYRYSAALYASELDIEEPLLRQWFSFAYCMFMEQRADAPHYTSQRIWGVWQQPLPHKRIAPKIRLRLHLAEHAPTRNREGC